ncbi:MAG: zinc ribbon domain-containing protein [Leptospiraceae bacterium]|nr:zinc ribbon domain-containing protein [Leptospiraceae bacterium]MCP5493755.1 zinc ribbon domain-containing protein [Leptospiraceae bacterium]
MPTYEYKCECGQIFEHFQSIKSEPLQTCNCEKKGSVARMISHGGGIIFKGSGFYVTDYKKSSPPSSEQSASLSESSASKSSSDSSSKTPTTKSE